MKKIFWLRFLAGLMCVVTLFGFGGCKKAQEEIVCGGTIDETDYDAPKVIESKEIVRFSAYFCLVGDYALNGNSSLYNFEITNNGEGGLTATETLTGTVAPADAALIGELQSIIDRYSLVENNGVYRYTAGIAPEYQKCSLSAKYASGEELNFTMPNEPEAAWAQEIYTAITNCLAESGVTLPAE